MLNSLFRIGILLVFLFVWPIASGAVEGKKGQPEPVVITAKTLAANNKEKTALFEGAVVAKRGEATLYADRMKIYYAEEASGSSIKKIEAEGNVKLIKDKSILTSQSAVYLLEPEERIVFSGEPRATEGGNIVTGSRMTYFIKDDRSVVEESKVFIMSKDKNLLRK